MHSSRMCTVHSCGHILGGCLLGGVSAWGGVCSGGSVPRGVSAPGGVCLGVSAWRVSAPGGGIPACTEADTPTPPLWTDRRLYKHNLRNFVADGNN